jgi:hypothetical protein
MNFKRVLTGAGVGAGVMGGIYTLMGAAAGAIGSSVQKASGNSGYDVSEATQMGAAGGLLTGAVIGLVLGSVLSNSMFSRKQLNKLQERTVSNIVSIAGQHIGETIMSGVTGYSLLNPSIMGLGKTGAALATGALITLLPVTYAALCVGFPLALMVNCLNHLNPPPQDELDPDLESSNLSFNPV